MKYAYIDNGVAVEVIQTSPMLIFAPHYASQFAEVPDNVQAGWVLSGGIWQAPSVDVDALKATHWESIKADRDRRTQQGGYQVDGKWFHSDTFSRTQQMALTMMGAAIPDNLQWKTMDGSFVTMTQTLAGQVFAAAAASDAALFARAEQIKAVMESDPVNFDLSAQSWSAVFGE
jgi:hypothetical protein